MLSTGAIAAWAVLIVLVGVGMAVWLLLAYTGGNTEANRVRLDAIRTAGTVVVGTGGAAALLLAARRQRTAEIALRQKDRDQADVARAHALQEQVAQETRLHQERVAAAAEKDAEARRITELYTKAVEQLGSDKAPVRLGGLYALERLAQDNPRQRQTIVNVWCAYLRMPYTPPDTPQPEPDAEEKILSDHRERMQEREVRLTAQRLITDHLRPGDDEDHPAETFWADTDLDLTGATLMDWNQHGCRVRVVVFNGAQFTGDAVFHGARFTGDAEFDRARFIGDAVFNKARFTGNALFHEARFAANAWFYGARFTSDARFSEARFTGNAWFREAHFTGDTRFRGAQFTDNAWFSEARFTDDVVFNEARFSGDAVFRGARFTSDSLFYQTRFEQGVPPEISALSTPPADQ